MESTHCIANVAPTVGLRLIEPPILDEQLCQGNTGHVALEIFHSQEQNVAFYYNDRLLTVTNKVETAEGTLYSLFVEDPEDDGKIRVATSDGCTLEIEVPIRPVTIPSFTYSSPSFDATGNILAREEVTFTNTSENDYSYSEWIFGDSTEHLVVLTGTASPVRHTYGISGNYFVTLRNYNSLGCSNEISIPIKIGKGYNILAPTVFTPNNDRVNDTFTLLFSGFLSVRFALFDSLGNQLYEESVRENDPEYLSGLTLFGWNGFNAGDDDFFIFTFEGVLLDGTTTVTRSGSFILLK